MNSETSLSRIARAALSVALACSSASIFASDSQIVPSYMQPLLDMSLDTSWAWMKPEGEDSLANPANYITKPSTVVIDGQKKIDIANDSATWEVLSKQPLIELAIPGGERRYVFTSMQSLLGFMQSADMLTVQMMVEDQYAKDHPKTKSLDSGTLADGDAVDYAQADGDLLSVRSGIPASNIHRFGRDTYETGNAKQPAQTKDHLVPGRWESDESVWVVDYPYVPGCGSRSIVGRTCGDAFLSRNRRFQPAWWHLDTGLFSSPDSAVVTSHGSVEDHVYTPFANNRDRNIWGDGVHGIAMARYADMVLSTQPGVVVTGRDPNNCPGVSPCIQSMVEYTSTTVYFKSPQFWVFCAMVENCRTAFNLPPASNAGVSFWPISFFQLIPDAAATYFSIPVAHDVQEVRVTSYGTRSVDPNQQDLAHRLGEGWAALMEAVSGCNSTVALPQYNSDYGTPRPIRHGMYCPVPRKVDGTPLLSIMDRSTGTTRSVFFFDETCLARMDPDACWRGQGSNVCSLVDLSDHVRYDLSALSPASSSGEYSRCQGLRGYQYNRVAIP